MEQIVLAAAQRRARARRASVFSVPEIVQALRRRSTPLSTVRGAVARLCRAGKVRRIAPGRYVLSDQQDVQSAIPTAVFPWWGSKRKMAPALVALLGAEKVRLGKRK
eukprot:4035602-Pyramimonas_sp.AAC.1